MSGFRVPSATKHIQRHDWKKIGRGQWNISICIHFSYIYCVLLLLLVLSTYITLRRIKTFTTTWWSWSEWAALYAGSHDFSLYPFQAFSSSGHQHQTILLIYWLIDSKLNIKIRKHKSPKWRTVEKIRGDGWNEKRSITLLLVGFHILFEVWYGRID